MNARMEKLLVKMREEDAVKVKPVKSVKKSKPAKVKSVPAVPASAVFDPKPTLMECVSKLTPEEAASPKNVAATVALQLLDQLMRSSRPTMDTLSDNAFSDLAYITSQVWSDKPDLKQVFSRAVTVADSIEFRTSGEEGSGIKSLHEVEHVLLQRKMKETR